MAQHEASTEVARAGEHGVTEHTPRHRHERPEDWGWHADLGLLARIGGVVTLIALLLMLTASHYNHAGDVALLFFIGVVVVGLIWDAQKRRNSWRR
jgi:drug/metabolite transporter (DMT)-like permease